MYNSKAEMLETKIEKILKKLKEEKEWAEEGMKMDDLDQGSYDFYKGVIYLAQTIEDI